MLVEAGVFNQFSNDLKKKVEEKISGFGKKVRYKFDISNTNPDPEKKNGANIWPFLWTLDPKTFEIIEKNEKGINQRKKIGMVDTTDEKGNPTKFKCVRIKEGERGIKEFDLSKPEDLEAIWYLELHPKNMSGFFPNTELKHRTFQRLDEAKLAKEQRAERSLRNLALRAAEDMSEVEVMEFASAVSWDTTEDIGVLRNMIEGMAESNPETFNDLINSKQIEYRAAVQKALDNQVIQFDPISYGYSWVDNNQLITLLSPNGEDSEVVKLAKWLQAGGDKADKVYKRIKTLLK
jgi:hypothetical protein